MRIGGSLCLAGALIAAGATGLAAQEDQQQAADCPLEGKAITAEIEELVNEAAELDSVAPEEAHQTYQEALTRARLALKQDPEDPAAHWLAARIHTGLGQYAKVDSMLNRFTELMPAEGCAPLVQEVRRTAWAKAYNDGIRAYQGGNDSLALESFEDANRVLKHPQSLNNAALLHQQRENLDRAEELYRSSLEVAEAREELRAAAINLAEVLRARGDIDASMERYTSYLQDYPDDAQAKIKYAQLLRETGQTDSATAVFDEVMESEDLGFREWFNLAVGLTQSQSFSSAVRAFEQARETRPHHKATMQYLMQAYMGDGNHARAVALGDTLVSWFPYEEGLYRTYMQALDRQGQTERVQQLLPKLQNMPLELSQLNMTQAGDGLYELRGQVTGRARAGQEVTIPFEFLDNQGNVIATQEATITLPGQGEARGFRLRIETDEPIGGFRYGEVGSGS